MLIKRALNDMSISIAPIAGSEADYLLELSDEYMGALYPAESNHLVSSESLRGPDALFLGAFETAHAGEAGSSKKRCVACVAAKFYDQQGYAEIKRLFVHPDQRGQKLGRRLMEAIEAGIRLRGLAFARLEMGIYQPEATALYQSLGYYEIEPFGSYLLDPLSQFMEKPF